MRLNKKSIGNVVDWKAKGYILPNFNRENIIAKTKKQPEWVHFGAGNIFRSFPALLGQELLESGDSKTGIIVVEGFDYEIIDKIYTPHDNLSILVTLTSDGNCEKMVIGSVTESIRMGNEFPSEFKRLKEIFCSDSLKIASFTITEKGYKLKNDRGEFFSYIQRDINVGPDNAESYMGMVVALLYERYLSGKKPIAMVSMDNFSHNGEKLESAIYTFVDKWVENGKCEKAFKTYVKDRALVSFPWSMIDKITPRPDFVIRKLLEDDGVEDVDIIVTENNTFISSFVNSERPQYLVVEDDFPNGRPPLEKAGVYFTDRETVNKVERMKVCTCLNPLHTALAIFGCLLGYKKISEEMNNPLLRKLVYNMGYGEGLPVVTNPGIISPESFIAEVLSERIPNPFLPDTPQRIATDTSQKLSIRFGETIKAYMLDQEKNPAELKLVPLVLAGWLRYLMGIDDEGNRFELSPDPLLTMLVGASSKLKLGDINQEKFEKEFGPLLKNRDIFLVDLKAAGLYDKIKKMFLEMTDGVGAVQKTLEKYIN